MFRGFIFMMFFCLFGANLASQKILDFDKLSIADGFTGSKPNAIIQDSKGFIWVGTWNGLNKYDGYSCEVFKPSYHDTTTLSNREVLALLEDHTGDIWIGTTAGLNRFNPATRSLKRYEFQNRIISLFEDSQHVIWVGTWNGGLYKLNPQSGDMEHYLTTEVISDIHEDSRNNLWVASYSGLINLDRNTGGYARYLHDQDSKNSISSSTVTQLAESAEGDMWVGTWGGGLNKVISHPDKDSTQFIHYKSHASAGSLSSDVIYRLHYDSYGNLWVGTWDAGLNLLDNKQQHVPSEKAQFVTYLSDLSDPYSISGNNISALFVDRTGMLWAGAATIDRANVINTGVKRYKTSFLSNGLFSENPVRSFADEDDCLWVGSSAKLELYKLEDDQFKRVKEFSKPSYFHNGNEYLSSSLLAITITDDGLWIGTEDAGLVFYPGKVSSSSSLKDFRFYNRDTEPALPGDKVSNVVQSKKYPGVMWVGTMQNGFAKLSYKKGTVEIESFRAGQDETSLSDNNIRSVVEDRYGKVWIGTQNGINCFDPLSNSFKKFFHSRSDSTSINENVINIIFEDRVSNLWVGTNSGLNKIKRSDAGTVDEKIAFKTYPKIPSLRNEIISNILEDDSLNLWLGLYSGLVKFDIAEEKIEKEFQTNEYEHVVIERNASLKAIDGTFFLGGANGFISFNPDSLYQNSGPPNVCITDVQIFNSSLDLIKKSGTDDATKLAIPYRKTIDLSYEDKVITFVFSSMDYKDPSKNEYAYLLDGFDTQWNEVGARNSATYTNLAPGEYTFKVKAANSDGIWNEIPAEVGITIRPPWWSSNLAFFFYMLLFIGLLYFFKQYSLIEVREKGRIEIEHLKNEKEHDLNELKSKFFTNITHEFRTPLTLIVGPAEELQKRDDVSPFAKKQADLIQRNAQRLLRLVNQLMEFRTIEKEKTQIFLQKCDIYGLLDDLYSSFKSMAESRNIEFSLIRQRAEIVANVDFDKYERVMFNILSNAFKYCEDGGKITIRAGIETIKDIETLVVEIEDTGIGIASENYERIFDRFFQANQIPTQSTGGIGLFLSKNYIDLHGGSIELESELGQGSCFKVMVPVQGQSAELSNNAALRPTEIVLETVTPATQGQESPVLEGAGAVDHSKTHVLIVEDDSELNEFIVAGLSPDFNVEGTFNGREGLDMARKLNPDIIITDIMMPEMDGFTMCKLLRKDLATSHIPVVFLTAKTMFEDEVEGLKIGAVDYISKPFNLVSLKLKIQNILENKQNVQDRFRTVQLTEPMHIELSSLDDTFLKDAVSAVNKFLDDPTFDVEKFSDVIGVSPNQVYRKIKALTGQTAKEFIRNQRLKTAATLLLQKKRTISEIIYMVGFSSPSYFTRCFKEYYGCTPKEYIETDGKVRV